MSTIQLAKALDVTASAVIIASDLGDLVSTFGDLTKTIQDQPRLFTEKQKRLLLPYIEKISVVADSMTTEVANILEAEYDQQ